MVAGSAPTLSAAGLFVICTWFQVFLHLLARMSHITAREEQTEVLAAMHEHAAAVEVQAPGFHRT